MTHFFWAANGEHDFSKKQTFIWGLMAQIKTFFLSRQIAAGLAIVLHFS